MSQDIEDSEYIEFEKMDELIEELKSMRYDKNISIEYATKPNIEMETEGLNFGFKLDGVKSIFLLKVKDKVSPPSEFTKGVN